MKKMYKLNKLLIVIVMLAFFGCGEKVKTSKNTNNPNTVQATVITEKVKHDTDDPAIWIHPKDATKSIIIGTV